MEESEKVWIASVAIGKRLEYDALKYSDYMYGKEILTDEVWVYVMECDEIGRKAFKEKYSQYKMYSW